MCSLQSTYAPLVPSPLNPAIFPSSARNNTRSGEAMTSRIRPAYSASGPTSTATSTPAPPVLPTKKRLGPSEKLLRRKAAEAWKMEALHRQVMEYERQALGGLSAKEKHGGGGSTTSGSKASESSSDSQDGKLARVSRRPPRRRVTRYAARGAMETVPEERQVEVERAEEEEEEEGEQDEAEEGVRSEKVIKWHHFLQMPMLSFLAPKKLAKSLRFVRVFASWRVRRRRKADRA